MKKNSSVNSAVVPATATPAAVSRIKLSDSEFMKKADLVSLNHQSRNDDHFQNVELFDFTLENKDLSHSEFFYSKFRNINFTGIDFTGVEFKFSEFENVTFTQCKMERTSFAFAKMNQVNFSECVLENSDFNFSAGQLFFTSCEMKNAEFYHAALELSMNHCNGAGVEFNYAADLKFNVENCDFHSSVFKDSVYHGIMKQTVLSCSEFCSSDCTDLTFSECCLRDLDMEDAKGFDSLDHACDDDEAFDF